MFRYIKRIASAFEQAAELSRINKEYLDPDEKREAMLAVICGNRQKQAPCFDRRDKDSQPLAA